jgi:polysaccharide export outer membrane protein
MKNTVSRILLAFYLLGNIPTWAEPTTPTFKLGIVRSGYSLGPGDVIKVGVLDFDEFSGQQMVLPDGTITLPVIGAVQAAGLSQEELAQELTDRLKPITKRPVVSVSLAFMRPLVVNITGEVRAPGPLQLNSLSSLPTLSSSSATAGTSLRIPLLSNAISNAGGVTRDADIRRISISRLNQQGGTSTFTVNLWDRITAQQAGRDIDLQDGDTVFIPKLSADDTTLNRRLLATSSLAPSTVSVRVVGEVNRPGTIRLAAASTLSGALGEAGGPTDKADLGGAFFTRLASDGRIDRVAINLSNLNDTEQVQEGDILVIPKSGVSNALDLFSGIFGPFIGLGSLLRVVTNK